MILKARDMKNIFAAFLMMILIVGCERLSFWSQGLKEDTSAEEKDRQKLVPKPDTLPLPETIGANVRIEGLNPVLVQGYGIVAGLDGKGSSECPEPLRQQLVSTIIKYQKLYQPGSPQGGFAEAFLNSLDTAVVSVMGYIPPGAMIGDRFDVFISALPNTSTISLRGGRLYTTELRLYLSGQKDALASQILAKAWGPVFIDPFSDEKTGKNGDAKKDKGGYGQKEDRIKLERKGRVLNGGIVAVNRRIYLSLNQPSYNLARTIEQRINSKFPPPADNPTWRTAKAINQGKIELHLPEQYRGRLYYFLDLVKNLYIRTDPAYIDSKARELAKEILHPTSNARAISFAWEAMGRVILPIIQPLYENANIKAAFFSARAGAALGDSAAVSRLIRFASEPGPMREMAIEALGLSPDYDGIQVLIKLLDDKDLDIRLRAYESLVALRNPVIRPILVGEDNFRIDLVPSRTDPFIWATIAGEPKFVIFGRSLRLVPPFCYITEDDKITILAEETDPAVKILVVGSDEKLIELSSSFDLVDFILTLGSDPLYDQRRRQPLGVGLVYSEVMRIIAEFCKEGVIPAKFILQEKKISGITRYSLERPEK